MSRDETSKQPTLRDQFAMSALNGMLACDPKYSDLPAIVARAYEIADEMLKARAK